MKQRSSRKELGKVTSSRLVGVSNTFFSTNLSALLSKEYQSNNKRKGNSEFELKAAAFEGNAVDVNMLAKLPTYDEAIARLMSAMKEASAGKLCRTIAAIRDQKEQEAA